MQQKQRFAAAGASDMKSGAVGLDDEMLHGSSPGDDETQTDSMGTEAADFRLSRLVWPAILAY